MTYFIHVFSLETHAYLDVCIQIRSDNSFHRNRKDPFVDPSTFPLLQFICSASVLLLFLLPATVPIIASSSGVLLRIFNFQPRFTSHKSWLMVLLLILMIRRLDSFFVPAPCSVSGACSVSGEVPYYEPSHVRAVDPVSSPLKILLQALAVACSCFYSYDCVVLVSGLLLRIRNFQPKGSIHHI